MKSYNKKSYSRNERVQEQIKKDISEIIRLKLKDPRAGFITITAVEVTNDYSYATIYFTVLENEKKDITTKILNNASSHIKKELSLKLTIFKTPELKFIYDNSIDRGIAISKLIDEINNKN